MEHSRKNYKKHLNKTDFHSINHVLWLYAYMYKQVIFFKEILTISVKTLSNGFPDKV